MYSKSRTEKQINEDACLASEKFLIVCDGASSLSKINHLDPSSDAAWFSHFLTREIAKQNDDARSLSDLLADLCRQAGALYPPAPDEDMPSAAIAILRRNDLTEQFDWLVLGDCSLLMEIEEPDEQPDQGKEERILCVRDESIAAFDDLAISQMQRLAKQKHEPLLAQRPFVHEILTRNRAMKNKPEGYAIADLTDAWQGMERSGSIPISSLKRAALFSDGFLQLQEFRNLDNAAFLETIFADPEKALEDLYNLQEQDAACEKLPRLKKRDDTTLVTASRLDQQLV